MKSKDDYADSMFRFERVHPRWIEACAGYLRYVFGKAIEGGVFLDYAFGRGNWSLAALQAGAARVIAIDAAEGNVRRFADHCRAQSVRGIEIIHGDVLAAPMDHVADVLWVYGILPCAGDCDALLARLGAMRRNDDAVALLYAYDEGSFRQAIVDASRRGISFADEQGFAEASYLFTPPSRLRARDDLTAPVMNWFSASGLSGLARRHGFVPRRQVSDFRGWKDAVQSREFAPYHVVCGFGNDNGAALHAPERRFAGDFAVIASLADAVWSRAGAAARRNLAIGLFNTHFTALPADGSVEAAVIEDFMFLMHAGLRLDVSADALAGTAAPYYAAAMAALVDAPRGFSERELETSPLACHLAANTIRF